MRGCRQPPVSLFTIIFEIQIDMKAPEVDDCDASSSFNK
jgi:hypothetical protein